MGFFTKKQVKLSAVAFNLNDYEELNYNQLVEVNGGSGGGFWSLVRNFFSGGKSSSSSSSSGSSASRSSSSYSGGTSSGSTSSTTSSSYGGCGGNVTKNSSGNKMSGNAYTDVIISYQKNANNKMSVSELTYDSSGKLINVKNSNYTATNKVKTPEERGTPVLFNGYYYYPKQFPTGSWELGKSCKSNDNYIGPLKIPTNAYQKVTTYKKESETSYSVSGTVNDSGYLIHSGAGSTTWGCIKMSDGDVALVAKSVDSAINSGGKAKLLVY